MRLRLRALSVHREVQRGEVRALLQVLDVRLELLEVLGRVGEVHAVPRASGRVGAALVVRAVLGALDDVARLILGARALEDALRRDRGRVGWEPVGAEHGGDRVQAAAQHPLGVDARLPAELGGELLRVGLEQVQVEVELGAAAVAHALGRGVERARLAHALLDRLAHVRAPLAGVVADVLVVLPVELARAQPAHAGDVLERVERADRLLVVAVAAADRVRGLVALLLELGVGELGDDVDLGRQLAILRRRAPGGRGHRGRRRLLAQLDGDRAQHLLVAGGALERQDRVRGQREREVGAACAPAPARPGRRAARARACASSARNHRRAARTPTIGDPT